MKPTPVERTCWHLVLCATALLTACAAEPLRPPITGHTCCNLRAEQGWVSSNNVQGGTLIPPGEAVQLTSIKKQYYVYGTVGGNEIAFRDDAARNQADTLRWLGQIITAEDPRDQLAKWPPEIRLVVRAAKVMPGMSKAQVLMSLGHPSRADTPDLNLLTWRYWTALDDQPVDLQFGDDGRLAHLAGKASAVRSLEYTP